jgi:CRISPR/Cas system-associated exonuclease Cas4 (RecB family)
MSNLVDEYDKLLNYLQSQKINGKRVVAQNPLQHKESKVEAEKEDKRKEVLKKTNQLIDNLQSSSFVPEKHRMSKQKGFDLKYFESMMRTRLIDEHKKLNSYERPYISVSELYNCLRQNYYVRKRYPVNLNEMFRFSYLYLIQRVGDKVHEVVQEVYNFSEIEKPVVSEKYKVKGRLDGIRESCLFEIKTYDDEKIEKTYEKDHYFQANIYGYILNFEYSYNIDTVVIIYVKRNLKKIFSYDLPIDNTLAKSYLERAPQLLKCLEKTEIPEPLGAKIQSCQYCLYKVFCEKDGFKEITPPYITKNTQQNKEKVDDPKKPVFLL